MTRIFLEAYHAIYETLTPEANRDGQNGHVSGTRKKNKPCVSRNPKIPAVMWRFHITDRLYPSPRVSSILRAAQLEFRLPNSNFQLPEVGFQLPTSTFRKLNFHFQLPEVGSWARGA